ncbi:sulfatase-like hydrolase/transferase [Bradyrhizobium sp. sGM-13]|uniref:sulfatase-like hydrolase/transferase n=1 Tax=Bradyrhizobium sp. sGM-13 TaxID=2831781 RepID=UPI001BCBCE3F|nr:sulfatase-like hydrolase/transferase [Bradyrhizobium sp. sGM-13]
MSEATTFAASGVAETARRSWRTLLLPFSAPNALLLAGGLLLPNLTSLVGLTSIVDIALPPRTFAIIFYASLAILARRIPFASTVVLFLCVLAFDIVQTLSLLFRLEPMELMVAIELVRHLHLFASPLYQALIGTIAATTLAALACLSRRSMLMRGNAILLFVLALAFATLDYLSNITWNYHFGSMLGRDKPVQSAAEVSGFTAAATAHGNNVVLVMVEGLGYLLDQAARERIAAPLFDADVTKDYIVTGGHTPYYGSTTSGEMRELCNTRTFYADFVSGDTASCLPNLLKARSYVNIAVHAFSGGMFERTKWYPTVGFDKELFGEDLVGTTHRTCGSTFRGACDADLAPAISAASREAAREGKSRFIYWLTLNTHVPIAPNESQTDFHCGRDGSGFGELRVCQMAELWHDVFTVVAKIARDPAVGPADILVVGDHGPPLWSRLGRAQFADGQVAWYRLQPRSSALVPRRQAQ